MSSPTTSLHSVRRLLRLPLVAALVATAMVAAGRGAADEPGVSAHGVVAAASPYAAEAGAEVLARGGNAIDAATTTAFMLMVAEPGMSGAGGRTVILIGRPGGKVEALDGATAWPEAWIALRKSGAAVPKSVGWKQVAVPGTLAATVEAQQRWGKLPLREVIRPAISLARTGFIVSRLQEQLFAEHKWSDDSAELRRVFLHADGTPYLAGERLKQPDLARTLELIALQGGSVLYTGEIGQALVAQMEKEGGYVRPADLAAYRPRTPQLDEINYGERRLVAMDRPTAGRSLLWRMQVLGRLPHYTDRADDTQALAELLAAPLPDGPAKESDAAERKRLLAGDGVEKAAREIAEHVAAKKSSLPAPAAAAVTNTTHFTVADGAGTVVSVTQTLGPYFGPGVLLPGYGIAFASTMGYLRDTDPSISPTSSIVPTLVFDRTGTPELALGGAGSARIPGAVLQVLHHRLDQGTTLAEALAIPRITIDRENNKSVLKMESVDRPEMQALVAALKARGIAAVPVPNTQPLGRVHAVARRPDGAWEGAADPRWMGEAVVPVIFPAMRTSNARPAGRTVVLVPKAR